jgi:hypothetical protein
VSIFKFLDKYLVGVRSRNLTNLVRELVQRVKKVTKIRLMQFGVKRLINYEVLKQFYYLAFFNYGVKG